MNKFESKAKIVGNISFPNFKNIRVMMMPFYLYDLNSIPSTLNHYKDTLKELLKLVPQDVEHYKDTPAYLTIDERFISKGEIQRNPGLHVDGMYDGVIGAGPWSGIDDGSWGSVGNGMLVVSNVSNSLDVYTGEVNGFPIKDGDCEHLRDQLNNLNKFSPKECEVVWADGLCVHEAKPLEKDALRQFIRISLPNDGVWFEDYTENPLGVKPKGRILPARIPSQRKLYNKEQ